jgi:hypothetical protein
MAATRLSLVIRLHQVSAILQLSKHYAEASSYLDVTCQHQATQPFPTPTPCDPDVLARAIGAADSLVNCAISDLTA